MAIQIGLYKKSLILKKDIKGVIRHHQSKERQLNDQKKKD